MVHLPSAGPRRLLEACPFRDEGHVEPVKFVEHPELRLYRIRLPQVEVIVLSWGYDDAYVSELIPELRPIGKEGPLFERSRAPSTERATDQAAGRGRGRLGDDRLISENPTTS